MFMAVVILNIFAVLLRVMSLKNWDWHKKSCEYSSAEMMSW